MAETIQYHNVNSYFINNLQLLFIILRRFNPTYMPSIEERLANIEKLLNKLLSIHKPVWVNEETAMAFMGRSKEWFKRERLGVGGSVITLYKGTDWRYINGRTPEYKIKSLEYRKTLISRKIKPTNNIDLYGG